MKIIFESKRPLNEDRMVKFGNQMYPKFGWCVILMGGAASGKGTAYSYKIPIEGDYYNPDNLKEIKKMWKIHTFDTVRDENGKIIKQTPTGRTHEDDFETPEQFRNMHNRAFVGELHNNMDDLSKRWKKSVYTTPDGVNPERLPNIIFDITAKKQSSIDEIVRTVKQVGYKVAIVWMLTKAELAIANNETRPRSVEKPILIDTHLRVMDTAEKIFDSGYISNIDEFWVVDTATDFNPHDFPKEYHDTQNVYKIPCSPDGLKKFDFVVHRIAYNRAKFGRELNRLAEN